MVRRDEQPHLLRATIVLDTRAVGHRGDGPASTFEWAISAAASIATSLVESGYGVRVVTDDVPVPWTGRESGQGTGELLDRLAVLDLGGPHELRHAHGLLARTGGDGLVVSILGEIEEGDVAPVAALPRRGVTGLAMLLRTTTWATIPARRRAELEASRERSGVVLDGAGWTVVSPEARDSVPEAWAQLLDRHTARTHAGGGGALVPGTAAAGGAA